MYDISIVVPVRNEERNIHKLCEHIHASMVSAHCTYEIIMVDDKSTDGTASIAATLVKKYPLTFYTKLGNQGKGYSIIEGASYAKSSVICMIDADLQYNPKHIPEMLQILKENHEVGLVVADRKDHKSGIIRRLASKLISFTLGTVLFGMHLDIQSGLKVFRKGIIKHLDMRAIGPWSLDIPLLQTTRELGYTIKQVPIMFDARTEGESKIHFVKSTSEIVLNALKLRISQKRIHHVDPHTEDSMIGAGVYHNRKKYITHSTLSHHNSAIKTLHGWQKTAVMSLLGLVAFGLFLNVSNTIIVAFALLNVMYFMDVFFNLYMTMKTLYTSTEIVSTDTEIENLIDKDLPVYTVLCPLYKEANIIPQFVDAMSKLEWPKSKLDVMLLLEEDDVATIQAAKDAHLPSFIRIVVVPHSLPKTKPKATNFGLAYAKGEYVVIYDAEDIPDVYQLKKAYLAFQKSPSHVVCLQAKLNYYNPHQNLLTRFFTAEYSLWFDLVLPGLQSIEAPLPLGGTSNHFRKEMLIQLEGWDSFNVTEDCDLGIRLARYGYQTAIIDSVTMEEANSNLRNWINQRSRWIKGYMQSYLVHMRAPRTFYRENIRDFFLFQMVVGGKVLALFVNPIMWIMSIAYFMSRSHYGLIIEKIFPGPVLYMAVISLVLGNFVYLYYYMIACAKREHYALVKHVFLIPLYWLAMSYAGYKALSELFYKPHFWQKTTHGLHLKPAVAAKDAVKSAAVPTAPTGASLRGKFAFMYSYGTWGIYLLSIGFSSILNFIFNAYIGRILSFEDLALIGLINGLVALIAIVSGALSTTISYQTGYLTGRFNSSVARLFWRNARKNIFGMSAVLACIWLLLSPFMDMYFNTFSLIPWLFCAPVILVNLLSETDRGYLAGSLRFGSLGIVNISEPLLKLSIVSMLAYLGYPHLGYTAIPLSVTATFFLSWIAAQYANSKQKDSSGKNPSVSFPLKFLLLTFTTALSISFFITSDVLFAKHYLSNIEAGQYAFVTMIGKMIFFLGTFASAFTTPLVSRFEGQGKNSDRILYVTLLVTILLTGIGYLILGHFGWYFGLILFGDKVRVVVPYLPLVTGSLALFTISKVFTDYYLVKKRFIFTLAQIILGFVAVGLIVQRHDSIQDFVLTMSLIWTTHLILNIVLHLYSRDLVSFENKLLNIFYTLRTLKAIPESKQPTSGMRILMFNWRDTKHKWSGGAEVYINELAKRWVQEGNSVTLFCGNGSRNSTHEFIDGIEIYRKGSFSTVYIWAFIYYILKFRGKYDIIIDAENGIPFFTPLYAREKVVLLIHHVHQEVFHRSLIPPLAYFAAFLEAVAMPFVYRHSQVVTVSPSSCDEIVRHKLTKKKPLIIHNGVDIDLYKPGKRSARPVIMYLGRLQYYKSLNIFIRAAAKVLEVNPQARFVIAGEGEERKKLEIFTRKLGISGKVQFLGKVDEKTKVSLFQKAWIFVNPSLMEGWGITTIEANACGTPVVTSRVSGLKDSVKDKRTGFLVPYGDVNAFAEKINELIANEKLHAQMSDESVEWAQTFTWDKSAGKFSTFLKSYATA